MTNKLSLNDISIVEVMSVDKGEIKTVMLWRMCLMATKLEVEF